jgi:hypothetical protein
LWCISLFLISYNLCSLPFVTDRTEAEQNQVNRTFASESLIIIINVVYNLMSPVLNSFLDEFLKDGSKIIIQTSYPKGSAVPFSDGLYTSNPYSAMFSITILEVRLLFSWKAYTYGPKVGNLHQPPHSFPLRSIIRVDSSCWSHPCRRYIWFPSEWTWSEGPL